MARVTKRQAEKVLADVIAHFDLDPTDENGPKLYDYTQEELSPGSWSIAWEGSWYDWPFLFGEHIYSEYNAKGKSYPVWTENRNGCIMSIHPY